SPSTKMTLVSADIPDLTKVTTPSLLTLIEMAPAAVPPKVTTPSPASKTWNVAGVPPPPGVGPGGAGGVNVGGTTTSGGTTTVGGIINCTPAGGTKSKGIGVSGGGVHPACGWKVGKNGATSPTRCRASVIFPEDSA